MNPNDFTLLHNTGITQTRFAETPLYPEGLYDLGHQVYAWLVPNGSWGESNAGLIVGNGQSLLVDTLWDANYTRQMLAAMQPLTAAAPIRQLVNTHADGDHFWGNECLPEVEAITSAAALAEMQHTLPKSVLLLGKVGRILNAAPIPRWRAVGHWMKRMVAPYAFAEVHHTPARRSFSGTYTLEVGGRTVKLLEVGPAHTAGDLIVYLPDCGIVFAGDALFIGSTPVMWAGPVENYLAALDRLQALDAEIFVPGHGPICGREGIAQVRAYWQYLQIRVSECHRRGLSAPQAARTIALSTDFHQQPFAQWNSPERIMVSTHTIYRSLQGRKDAPKVPELLRIMMMQAALAQELPAAQPACMRLKPQAAGK
ncbi:MAG: MBL fold metallo-hydrolase [Longilinea sp.]|nr:MBL fold metallo-hydrolase [Longilinea sp.]